MDDLERIRELAGLSFISEAEAEGYDVRQLSYKIVEMAEKNIYDAAAEGKVNVTHDDIFNESKRLLAEIEREIFNYLEKDFNK